jgi:DNA-binding winged helix-turn-helix (wHTH) protein
MAVRFGEFLLDPQRRQLLRGEDPVHLTPKAFDLLTALVDRRPGAVGKEVLESHIWGSTHVAETSLAGLVAELRNALGDRTRDSRFIRTVHGFGYAFCATATTAGISEASSDRPVFRIAWDRREVSLHEGENILGRVDEAAVWMDSPSVSRRHARILIAADRALIEDLASRNGTFVRNERVRAPTPLYDGDEIRLGSVVIRFRMFKSGETESQAD